MWNRTRPFPRGPMRTGSLSGQTDMRGIADGPLHSSSGASPLACQHCVSERRVIVYVTDPAPVQANAARIAEPTHPPLNPPRWHSQRPTILIRS